MWHGRPSKEWCDSHQTWEYHDLYERWTLILLQLDEIKDEIKGGSRSISKKI